MKKKTKFLIIGIVIIGFIIWSILDQQCFPFSQYGTLELNPCEPEPRWLKWIWEL